MVTLDVSVRKVPCQVTDPLILPPAFAKLASTGKAKPDRNTSSLPESGIGARRRKGGPSEIVSI